MKQILLLSLFWSLLCISLFSQNSGFPGITYSSERPPDPSLAVGPDHIVQVVNKKVAFFSKSGNMLSSAQFSEWFSSLEPPSVIFDPKVIYDHYSERFVVLALARTGYTISQYLIAVSLSSDPTGEWHFYSTNARLDDQANTLNYADFSGLGFNNENIFITSNQLTIALGQFDYSKVRVFQKSELYADEYTESLTYKDFIKMKNQDGTFAEDIKPVHMFDGSSDYYLMNTKRGGDYNYVNIWNITNPFTTPLITLRASLNIGTYNLAPSASQKGSSESIDVLDCRISDVVCKNGYLYGCFTVKFGENTGSAIKYLKINANNNTIVWNNTYGADNKYYFYPEIYPDQEGNAIIVFNKSSSDDYAGIGWTYRKNSSQEIGQENWIKEGEGPYVYKLDGVNRWGDYSGIAIDPSDGDKIWICAEYATTEIAQWSTWITYLSLKPSFTVSNELTFQNLIYNPGGTFLVNGITPINSGIPFNLPIDLPNSVKSNDERFVNFGSSGINYKHNKWNDEKSEFKLSHNFTSSFGNNQTSKYLPLDYTKIQVKLEGQVILGKGAFQFQDPWYVINENQTGDYWKSCISTYEPNGKEGASEKGIFLRQYYADPSSKFYSLNIESYQEITIGSINHKFYFQNWDATLSSKNGEGGIISNSADFEDANATQTKVVFNNAGAIINANLKGNQLSNSSNTFSNNSQRKIIRTSNGYIHMVYESMGRVWYERSTDDGETWSIMNEGKPMSTNEAKLPAIDSYMDQVAIVFQERYDLIYKIQLEVFNPDGGHNFGSIVQGDPYYGLFNEDPYSYNSNPVVAWS